MSKEQHMKKIENTLAFLSAEVKMECDKLYNSGMIDTERYSSDSYVLAQILVTAALRRLNHIHTPDHNKEYMDEVSNLEVC